MRNLNKLATSLVALFFVVAFSSCEKQATKDSLQDVSFNVNNVTNLLKKAVGPNDERIPTCTDADPAYVIATINGEEYQLDILSGLNDGTETQVVKLNAGTYSLDGFMVYDIDDNLLWAAPTAGSYYANLWGIQGVSFDFEVEKFAKTKIDIDVLCWEEYTYKDFGFNWLDFQKITIKTICFFGDICPGEEVVDYVAGYTVKITSADNILLGEESFDPSKQTGPLCIEYPEFGDLTDETYIVTISLNNAPEDDLAAIGTLNADTGLFIFGPYNNMTDLNGVDDSDGIFDFMLYWGENCNYDGNAGVNAIFDMNPRP